MSIEENRKDSFLSKEQWEKYLYQIDGLPRERLKEEGPEYIQTGRPNFTPPDPSKKEDSPHILLENGYDILLEDTGLILLEEAE